MLEIPKIAPKKVSISIIVPEICVGYGIPDQICPNPTYKLAYAGNTTNAIHFKMS